VCAVIIEISSSRYYYYYVCNNLSLYARVNVSSARAEERRASPGRTEKKFKTPRRSNIPVYNTYNNNKFIILIAVCAQYIGTYTCRLRQVGPPPPHRKRATAVDGAAERKRPHVYDIVINVISQYNVCICLNIVPETSKRDKLRCLYILTVFTVHCPAAMNKHRDNYIT
jgi:hypothetical protein